MSSRPRFPFHSCSPPILNLFSSRSRVSHPSLSHPSTSSPHTSFSLRIIDVSSSFLTSTLSSLVRISLTSSFYQAARLARTRARGPFPVITTRFFHPRPVHLLSGLRIATMSSSEEDVPLVRANGRANRKSPPGDSAGICTPSALILFRGHLSSNRPFCHFSCHFVSLQMLPFDPLSSLSRTC